MADRFSGLDISYDDKRWGNIIDPGEWNQNFHEIEDWVNALVTDLNNGILTPEDVQELFDEFSETFAKTEDVNEMLGIIQSAVNEKVSKSGDTLTGALTLSGNPTNPLHAATKQYVDDNKLQNVQDGTNTSVLLGDIENNVAGGSYAVAEGSYTKANGQYSHAEGYKTETFFTTGHAEGSETFVDGGAGHAEGYGTTAVDGSHAEGHTTIGLATGASAEGHGTAALGRASHAEGLASAFGVPISYDRVTHILDTDGIEIKVTGSANATVYDFTCGEESRLINEMCINGADYNKNTFIAYRKDAIFVSPPHWNKGATNSTIKDIDFDNMKITVSKTLSGNALTNQSVYVVKAENVAYGIASHVEGFAHIAAGNGSHAEGEGTHSIGQGSHAEGLYTFAEGNYSHAEGGCSATDPLLGGRGSSAYGDFSHAEGYKTQAVGNNSHSEGRTTVANGDNSHAEGFSTIASGNNQHVFGKHNVEDVNGNYIEIVGNGRNNSNRSNARTLDWNGNEVLAGKLTVGSSPTNDMDVVTKQYVDNIITITGTTLNIL